MKKIVNYIKANKIFCFIMVIGFILLLFQMKNVVMYADDFALKVISNKGWENIFKNQINHYFNWGGGFTPILVTSLLRFGLWSWKLLITLLITLIISLSIKLAQLKTDKQKSIMAILLWDFVFFVSILVTRETIYWLDGSMAYVFTTFQVFLYISVLVYKIFYNNKLKRIEYFLIPMIAFLAGWSSAQTGAITFVVPTLIIAFAYIFKKYKVRLFYHLVNVIGIIGFGIFYFAPGNSVRMSVMGDFANYNIIQKILYRASNIYTLIFNFNETKLTSLPIFILIFISLLVVYGLMIIKKKLMNKNLIFLKISIIILLIFLISNLYICLNLPYKNILSDTFINFNNIKNVFFHILPYITCTLVMLSTLVVCYYISTIENKYEILIFPVAAYLSQGIMVMSPYSSYRTELIALIFIWPVIALIFTMLYIRKNNFIYMLAIPFLIYNIYLSILILILFLSELNKKESYKTEVISFVVIFTFLSLANYSDCLNKYSENKVIYENNIRLIKNHKSKKEIYITNPKYIYYGFGGLNSASYVEDSLKIIYNLKDVKFISIGDENYEEN